MALKQESSSVVDNSLEPAAERGPLANLAGTLLVAAAFLLVAAIVAFGSAGRRGPWGWVFVALGLAALVGWYLGRRGEPGLARDSYARRRTVVGTNAVTSTLLLLALLVGVNYLATRRHKVFDLTSNRVNSLAPQTTEALGKLKNNLKLTYIFLPSGGSNTPDPAATALLNAYTNASDKVQVEYLNAAANPLEAQTRSRTFTGQPLLMVQSASAAAPVKGKTVPPAATQEVTVMDEQNVTSAIMKLQNPQQRTLYFLSGHGEASPENFGSQGGGISAARTGLEGQNYTIKTISLLGAAGRIPADAAALIVAGPKSDLTAAEEQKFKTYISGKGRLVLMLDPTRQPLPRWYALARSLGLEASHSMVLDMERAYESPQFLMGELGDTSRHQILRAVGANVVFPGAIAMKQPAQPAPDLQVTPLFETSASAQSVPLSGGGQQRGTPGTYVIAAAIERTQPAPPGQPAPPTPVADGLRAVVIGNASYMSGDTYHALGNGSFFLAAVNWTVGNDALVTIPPKPPVENRINLEPRQLRFIVLLSLLALPMTALILGTVVWWQRR